MRLDARVVVVAAVPVLSTVVGLAALPRPVPVAEAAAAVDRASLGAALSTTPTSPRLVVDAKLGSAIVVRGADLPDAAVSRGARLPVKLHFGVTGAVDDDWQVFVHIDAEEGGFRINGDHWPVQGRYRTSFWQRGEFVVDAFDVVVPVAAPAGTYHVWVGLYRGNERLTFTGAPRRVDDGENRVKVGSVVLE